jgi:ribosomal protein RSM22 (predicted rRNA methylase)
VPPAPLQLLDLGCGAGASSLAAAFALRARPMALTALDHSPAAVATLRQIFHDCAPLWPHATLDARTDDARADGLPGPFDVILASFVLNELFPADELRGATRWLRRQLQRLSPNGLLVVIEPAGAAPSTRLQRLRDTLVHDPTLTLAAPCLHRHPCPMLAANQGFCHDVRSWRVPDSVHLINRRLFRSVQDLKFSLLAVRRAPPAQPAAPDDRFRLVAPMSRAKGRLLTRGCCADGTLRTLELMTRALPRDQVEALASAERGDLLRMISPRLLGDGRTWRVTSLSAASGLDNHPSASLSLPP